MSIREIAVTNHCVMQYLFSVYGVKLFVKVIVSDKLTAPLPAEKNRNIFRNLKIVQLSDPNLEIAKKVDIFVVRLFFSNFLPG